MSSADSQSASSTKPADPAQRLAGSGNPAGPGAVPSRRRRRSHLWLRLGSRAALLAVGAFSLYLLLPSLAAVFGSWKGLERLNWWWTAVGLACEAASFASLWQLERVALRTRQWFAVVASQLAGNAAGRIIPGGGATAAAVASDLLRRAGIPPARAATALAASTALQLGATCALPLLAVPAIATSPVVNHSLVTSAYLGIGVLALLLVGGAVGFVFDRPLILVACTIQAAINRFPRRAERTTDLPERTLEERNTIRQTIGARWQAALLSATGNIAFDYLALLCILRAVGAKPRPTLVLIAYTSAVVLALIPLTPGGLGFVEAGLAGTLALAGVAPANAVLATLAYRLVSFWLPIPVGAVAYVIFRRRFTPGRAQAT